MDKNPESFLVMEKILVSIRDFFSARGFHEVQIPIFNASLPLEPNIYAFKVGKYFLPTSPEATLKKAIGKGIGNCFAIGHTFRDMEGTSPIHRPEFLMLEWYREDADYRKIMDDCKELIMFLNQPRKGSPCKANLSGKWKYFSMSDLFRKYAELNLAEIVEDKGLAIKVKDKGYEIKDKTWEQIFNQIFLNEIEPNFPKSPFFVIDYPARMSPLCAKRKDKPYLAERFELYIDGIEIANGNTENTDADEVFSNMKKEEKYRKKAGILSPPIDMEFISALRIMQKKSYAGIGLGVERLAMLLTGIENIDDLQ